uniref:Uncharacterized protein n=1 Tax=Onchocerca volvulus TaxID=6282 RepID=A0A8R1XKL2_ONCVO
MFGGEEGEQRRRCIRELILVVGFDGIGDGSFKISCSQPKCQPLFPSFSKISIYRFIMLHLRFASIHPFEPMKTILTPLRGGDNDGVLFNEFIAFMPRFTSKIYISHQSLSF